MSSGLRTVVLGILTTLVIGMWAMAWLSKRFDTVAKGVAALEARHFETLSVVAVGTGGTFENHNRSGPAIAVGLGDDLVLVDAGRGVAEALRAAEIPTWQPSHLLISQLVPENTLGLDDLWLSGWLGRRDVPLQILGPPGTAQLIERLRSAYEAEAQQQADLWGLPAEGGLTPVQEISDETRIQLGEMEVSIVPLAGADPPALGVRAESAALSVAIATRGKPMASVEELARDADWLWTEALYGASLDAAVEAKVDHLAQLQNEGSRHLRLEEAGELATRAGVRGLVLIRLRPPPVFTSRYRSLVNESFSGAVVLPEDGEVVE
ncbi:MAG: hypothetical protein GY946_09185 [bacterium]|nr:hypothetical protein [bacterium]